MKETQNTITISLTGENSHQIRIPKGQGSLSIGTKGLSEGKYDIWVEDNCPIDWDAFNGFYIPASLTNPNGLPMAIGPDGSFILAMTWGFCHGHPNVTLRNSPGCRKKESVLTWRRRI